MLRNFLLITFRTLWHNKFYTLINIVGLAIGITASLFIFQFVQFENSYDSFHEKADRIYRVINQATINGFEESPQHNMTSDFAPMVKEECPEIVNSARISKGFVNQFIFSFHSKEGGGPQELMESKVYYADPSFLEIFSFPMIMGDAQALQQPNTMVLSEKMAEKIFGTNWEMSKPVGKSITLNGKEEFMVTGVVQNVPENSHLKFEVLLSLPTLASTYHYDTEGHNGFLTYFEVDPSADIKELEEKLMQVQDKHWGEFLKQHNASVVISLQPLKEAHLYSSTFKKETEIRGNATTVQFLLISGCFILLLAWINYVNLSTARAVKRAKEVGIRKVVGAARKQLIAQFLLEAFLINLLSLILAGTMYQLCYTSFTQLVQRDIPINSLIKAPSLLIGIGLLLLLGTLLSGGYAAFVLSSFKAVSVMKGKFFTSARGLLFRKSLIVFQFMISVGLIIGTFCVYQQLVFMKDYEKGYDMSQKLIVRAPGITSDNYGQQYENFKTALQQLPDIQQITASYLSPGDPRGKGDQFVASKKNPEKGQIFSINGVDYDYLETYDIELQHGRGFTLEFPADQDAVVITEGVALELGFEPVETALLETLYLGTNWLNKEVQVIGIVKDISLYSLTLEQTGVIFIPGGERGYNSFDQFNYFTIGLDNLSHLQEKVASIEALYKAHFYGNPFDYFFLDEYFNAQYRAEEQFGKVFTAASGLAIFIACIGLAGLVSFMAVQKTQEIGIRKVLGASVRSILTLLSLDFFKLILISGLIATPIAYLVLKEWLSNYAFHIDLSWWMMIFPLFIVIGVSALSVIFQAFKAASGNPVDSLRYE
ncbi:ABC transporter permease [Catalinimonas sp. 4WD22]|uniref:ABC transporter permease n=1 Tax=Catalinimonas locisalis TaxID=3133978 RepID=UPI00310168A0